MRDFFIRGLEIILNVIVVLMIVGVIAAAGFTAFSNTTMVQGMGVNGPLAGLFILVAGLIYVIFVGGFMYLGLGIYQNTKRTADLLANR